MHGNHCAANVDGVAELQLKAEVVDGKLYYRCYKCSELIPSKVN